MRRNGFFGSLAALLAAARLSAAEPVVPATVPAPAPAIVRPALPTTNSLTVPECTDSPCLATVAPEPPGNRIWLRTEYLLWWLKNDHAPPLVTTGPASFPVALLNSPTTRVLANGDLSPNDFSGGRFTAGFWLNDCRTVGAEIGYFFLGQRTDHQDLNSGTFPVLARPFFNLNSGTEDTEFAAFPGLANGHITIAHSSQLWGAEANARANVLCGCGYRLDLLAGFRYLDLDESLAITEAGVFLPGTGVPQAGNAFVVADRFGTRDQFYGGQVGAEGELNWGRLFLDLRAKVALGTTQEEVNIHGGQQLTSLATGAVTVAGGGLLAEPSNSGQHHRSQFSVLPEVGIDMGYQLTRNIRAYVGYDFLYWYHTVRPGGQIDRGLDVTQIPNFGATALPTGLNRPAVTFRDSDFWAHGVDFGLEFRY